MRALPGRTALITGAGRRLGRAMALGLARAGTQVIVHYNQSGDEAQAVAEAARACGVQAWAVAADLAHAEGVAALLAAVRDLPVTVDVLVNNASIYPESAVMSLDAAAIDRNMRLHVAAPLALAQGLFGKPKTGDIVNLLDARITAYDAGHAGYHLSKRALFTLTRMLALELAPAVRVNAIAPGAVLPPVGGGAADLERLSAFNPLQAHGSAEGVVETLLFLLRSDFITGQVIYYDGGYHLRGSTYG